MKPAAKRVPVHTGCAFQPTGLQVLFAVLCNPDVVNKPYRELAVMAGVAHGTVGWVMPDLQQLGYLGVLKGRRGPRRLFHGERLLGQWADAYARLLRPRTLIGRYYVRTLQGWKDWPLAEHGALWGVACRSYFHGLSASWRAHDLRRQASDCARSKAEVPERTGAWPHGNHRRAQALLEFPGRPKSPRRRPTSTRLCGSIGNW